MATAVPTNRVPEHCRCSMVRGSDLASRDIRDAFSPNPDALFCLADDPREYELCLACERLEVCHGRDPTETMPDIAKGGDTPEARGRPCGRPSITRLFRPTFGIASKADKVHPERGRPVRTGRFSWSRRHAIWGWCANGMPDAGGSRMAPIG